MTSKTILTIAFLTVASFSFGQDYFDYIKKSSFYINTEETSDKITYNWIGIKNVEKDTVINRQTFTKYNWQKFRDYNGEKHTYTEYELLTDKEYTLLDSEFNSIHKIRLTTDQQQIGLVFGQEGEITLEYIDTRTYFPRDTLIPDDSTPRKYYLKKNPAIYLIYQPTYQIVEVFKDGNTKTKYMVDELFSMLTESIDNKEPIKPAYNLYIGDAIQVVYRNQYFSDSLQAVEYKDKQIITMECYKDTVLNDLKTYVFKTTDYSYSFGQEKTGNDHYISLTDSGYYINFMQFIPSSLAKPDFKIDTFKFDESQVPQEQIEKLKEPFVSFSGYIYYTIGDKEFPLVVKWESNSPYYNHYYLTDFPMGYIEFGNVKGEITYPKINGTEYGEKISPPEKTDKTHIRKITQTDKTKIEIVLYLKEDCEVEFSIEYKDDEKEKLFSKKLKAGKHNLTLKTKELERDKYYGIAMQTSCSEGHSGHTTTGFYARKQ